MQQRLNPSTKKISVYVSKNTIPSSLILEPELESELEPEPEPELELEVKKSRIKLTNEMLRENRNYYNIEDIIYNVDNLDLKLLLCSQILTADFCINYILNDEYVTDDAERKLFCDGYVLCHQKHLTKECLIQSRNKL